MKNQLSRLLPGFTWKRLGLILLGAGIVSFGLYNIHQQCGVTEGGVLGTVLLIHHWLGLPASVITPILDLSCYALAMKVLGGEFIRWSIASTAQSRKQDDHIEAVRPIPAGHEIAEPGQEATACLPQPKADFVHRETTLNALRFMYYYIASFTNFNLMQ